MKYIKKFEEHINYNTYINGINKLLPNISYCEDNDHYHFTQSKINYSKRYFTTTALEPGTISFIINQEINTDLITSISYSLDNGTNWVTTANQDNKESNLTITVNVNEGDKILWKGIATSLSSADNGLVSVFKSTCDFDVKGNIMSLLYGDNFVGELTLEHEGAFHELFGDDYIAGDCLVINAKDLVLPATTLAQYCYDGMFTSCPSLVTAPELPATTLADYCYQGMFTGCTSLVTTPELPATTLATSCYAYMFQSCTSLVTTPELPATTLATDCYSYMFKNCTALVNVPTILPATILMNNCYYEMFRGCTSLTTAPELPATTLVSRCYHAMFYGCTSLNYIKAMFTTTPGTNYTSGWVYTVASAGTFVKNSAATWSLNNSHSVPSGWATQLALPYDEVVEYIECNGRAYIDTGIRSSSNITFNLDFYMPNYAVENQGYWLFGSRASSSKSQLCLISYTGYVAWCYGTQYNQDSNINLNPGRYVFSNETSSNIIKFGNYSITNTASSWSSTLNFYLFTLNNNGSLANVGTGLKFYGGKIYSSGTLVRDYIPVCKNGDGYLYDKVSGNLFGNANSIGSFTYKDKLYDLEVEYLQSNGNEYIDTGINLVSGTTKVEILCNAAFTDFSYNNNSLILCESSPNAGVQIYTAVSNSKNMIYNQGISKEITTDTYYNITCVTTSGSRSIQIDDGEVSTQSFSRSISDDSRLYIIGSPTEVYVTNARQSRAKHKLYKIYINDTLVRNYIPVQKNNIGYLYDKVSEQLFGNAASSGSFITKVYDSEVEYLQSDGVAYINLMNNINSDIDAIDIEFKPIESASATSGIFGIRGGASIRNFSILVSSANLIVVDANNSSYEPYRITTTNVSTNVRCSAHIDKNNRYVEYEGVQVASSSVSSQSFTTIQNALLFRVNGVNGVIPLIIYSLQWRRNNNLLLDLIPVRKNGIGYMYDRISGQLFGNAAPSGSFTYGNDVS